MKRNLQRGHRGGRGRVGQEARVLVQLAAVRRVHWKKKETFHIDGDMQSLIYSRKLIKEIIQSAHGKCGIVITAHSTQEFA